MNSPGYCCSFDVDDSSPLLYCGLANGSTVVYDTRQSKSPLYLLNDRQKTGGSPVHSIEMIRINNNPFILCANLTKFYAWELDSSILAQSLNNDNNDDNNIISSNDVNNQCHILSIDNLEGKRKTMKKKKRDQY